jgi:small-conductance mechanosensitive channel
MESEASWFASILPYLPSAATTGVVVVVLFVARLLLEKRRALGRGRQLQHQLIMILLTLAGLLVVILVLPIRDATRGQLLTLAGILLSAAIALSSTTFIGNAMAGVMLRAVRNFRTGDFICVGDLFGRVSERGLFHTEIQTEDRDLTTLPNLYLISHPVTVMRSSGTILSSTVSLGYDIPRSRIESLLLQAGEAAGLKEPFVQVLELGDFSVTYRVAGLLTEVKHVLSARSGLRTAMLDQLHRGGVEIVSPSFMNTRTYPGERRFIAREERMPRPEGPSSDSSPEALAFDKAEEAESREMTQQHHKALVDEIEELGKRLEATAEGPERERQQRSLERLEARRDTLARLLEKDEK